METKYSGESFPEVLTSVSFTKESRESYQRNFETILSSSTVKLLVIQPKMIPSENKNVNFFSFLCFAES